MRTTLNLDDDVFTLVRHYAEGRSMALGKAVSELVRRGLASPSPMKTRRVNGISVVVLPLDSPVITTEHVKQLESELE
jgi:hypothetical protein